mmetsp:Transcript_34117/g.85883  ORF Transcript_34117/g.85883 Transcript_34117/m.85883 type:complete len:256 (+) Transcript_34117:92-859(+)
MIVSLRQKNVSTRSCRPCLGDKHVVQRVHLEGLHDSPQLVRVVPPLPGGRCEADDEDPLAVRCGRHQRVVFELEVVVRQAVARILESVHDLGVVHRVLRQLRAKARHEALEGHELLDPRVGALLDVHEAKRRRQHHLQTSHVFAVEAHVDLTPARVGDGHRDFGPPLVHIEGIRGDFRPPHAVTPGLALRAGVAPDAVGVRGGKSWDAAGSHAHDSRGGLRIGEVQPCGCHTRSKGGSTESAAGHHHRRGRLLLP